MLFRSVLQNFRFDHPTFMAFGPDGALYVLEYGLIWYSQNDNARLSRIIYSEGNRPPVAIASANDSIGNMPLKIKFSAAKSYDNDHDKLSYEWSFTGNQADSKDMETEFTYTQPGIYRALLTVKDANGARSTSTIKVIVGNTYPVVDIELIGGNKSFYFEDAKMDYKVTVTDKEDGVVNSTKINTLFAYIPEGKDIYPTVEPGHSDAPTERSITENPLIAQSDCKACMYITKNR